MSIIDACTQAQSIAAAVTGITNNVGLPDEKLNQLPAVLAYPADGKYGVFTQSGPADSHGNYHLISEETHVIIVEVHVSRSPGLQRALAQALPLGNGVAEALLQKPTLNGTINVMNDITYKFGPLDWGAVKTVGWAFRMTVSINRAIP